MSSFYVGFDHTTWPYRCQFQTPNTDGDPQDDCGETVDEMILEVYGKHYDHQTIHQYLLGSAKGLTFPQDRQKSWKYFAGVDSVIRQPAVENGDGGLLRYEWTALKAGMPCALNSLYLDANGNPTGIRHWIAVIGMDEAHVYCADPATGALRTETYDQHFARSQQYLVIPATAPSSPV